MLRRLLPLVAFAFLQPVHAAEPDSAALDKIVADAMAAQDIPGAAVAIVKDDKVIFLKGFGVREKGKPDLVSPDTVFAIASCSKAFTATAVGLMIADGKMNWDDPVRKHLDWFHLTDPSADRDVTIRDLLSHRTGMPRHDMLWAAAPNSPEENIRAYGHAKPNTSFRSTWEYANIPFTAAGVASGLAAGSDWATLVKQRIFEPLGMATASCSAREALARPDVAVPHNRHPDGKIGPVERANVDSVRGAGSINASVRDMANWLRFQLADGSFDGKRLLSPTILKETRTAQMVVRQEGRWKIFFPEKTTRHLTYGLGWFVHDYRGHSAVSHGGTLDGFRAQTMLIPDKKLGVVVFGNLTPSTFPEALAKTLLDALLGLPDEKWSAFYKGQDAAQETGVKFALAARVANRKPDTKPSKPLSSYAGTYSEPAYGKAEITATSTGLTMKWGRLTYRLDHYHFDTFSANVIAPPADALAYQRATEDVLFRLGTNGEVEGLKFLGQDFKRSADPAPLDAIVRGGMIYDGSGNPPRKADIGIRGDKITAIGDLSGRTAPKIIDATGLAVAPGFINMLSWSTDAFFVDGRGQSEIRQGVTTQIMGEGWSWGPVNDAIRKRMKADQTDIKYDIEWNTLAEYLYFLERKGISQNVASYIGAATVREYVIGLENKKATTEQMDRMRKLVELEMKAGALGIGTALEYPPGYFADTEELVELCKVAAVHKGKYVSHMRSEGDRLIEGIDEVIRISREAKIPAEIYHLKAAGPKNWSKMDAAIAKIEAARKEGLPITANMYPYTAGAAPLTACIPPWAREGGDNAMRKRLKDPTDRKRVVEDVLRPKYEWPNFYANAGGAKGIVLLGMRKDHLKPLQGKTLEAVALARKAEPVEVLMDLLVEDESPIGVAYFITAEENIKKLVPLPWISFGSDESAQAPEGLFLKSIPHPRAYGCFARVLGKYVRDEKALTLELAVRKLSELPATNLGLDRRGSLKKGHFADIVVFDPKTIADRATYENPHQYAIGMKHVFVNGMQVLKDGEHTGAKPGKAVWGPGKEGR